jgi:hypothetical protein
MTDHFGAVSQVRGFGSLIGSAGGSMSCMGGDTPSVLVSQYGGRPKWR